MVRCDAVLPLTEAMIEQRAATLDYLCRETQEIRGELSAFLSEYYRKVGPFLTALGIGAAAAATVRRATGLQTVPPPRPCPQNASIGGSSATDIQRRARDLYLMLVKKLHPDRCHAGASEDLLKEVTAAYREGRLGGLWKILFSLEWKEIQRFSPYIQQSFLRHYEESLHQATMVMEREFAALSASPENLLRQRVFAARLRGEDLLSHIVEHLRAEEGRHRRHLQYRAIRRQLMQEAAWG